MNRLLILSDNLASRSDEDPRSFVNSVAPPPPPSRAQAATDRTAAAGIAGRDLQTLRAAKLPLRGWTGTRPEALPVHQPARWAAPPGLRAQRHPRAVAQFIDNFRKLRDMLDEICAINAELLRRREDLE
jgi:hypothetical protein